MQVFLHHSCTLDALIEKGQMAARSAPVIDWDAAVKPPRWLPRRTYVNMVSQLLHGERATTDVLKHLATRLDDPLAKTFIGTQIADEERHQALYTGYLERLGDIAPPDEAIQQGFAAGLDWNGPWQGIIVACHVILEGEALKLQQDALAAFDCLLLRQVSRQVMQDEARHVAFGKVYVAPAIAALSADERRDIYVWVKRLWREAAQIGWRKQRGIGGLAYGVLKNHYMRKHWATHERSLRAIGLIQPGDQFA